MANARIGRLKRCRGGRLGLLERLGAGTSRISSFLISCLVSFSTVSPFLLVIRLLWILRTELKVLRQSGQFFFPR